MKLRPYQAPRRQPKINDMIYPPGSRQGGNVWIGGILMNVQKDATPPTPTPTPSITPTNTLTPTPSTTPNALCPQEIVISNSTSQYAPNGTYTRSTTYTGGTFFYPNPGTFDAAFFANTLIFTGTNGLGVNGALYILQSGSTYYQLVIENNNYWTIVRNSGATSLDGGTLLLPRVVFSSNTLTDGIISSPTTGTKSIQSSGGPDEGTIYISYPAFCPTPTPTPTPSITPTQTPTPTSTVTPTPSVTPTQTVTPSITPTSTLTPTPTPSSSPIPSGTTEANAYLTRVVTAGGTGITSTISAATTTLFTSLVSNNLYNKLFAFYPHLGGISASCALNAKSTGNTITFNGGWTFSNELGSKPNGTNGYGSVAGVAPNTIGTLNSAAIGALLSTVNSNPAGNSSDIGVMDTSLNSRFYFAPYFNNTILQAPRVQINANTPVPYGTGQTNTVGTFMISRTGATQFEYYSEGALQETFTTTTTALGTRTFVIAGENEGGLVKFYSNRAHGFTFFGSGLSGAEASTLTTIIKTWATAISRTN